MYDVEELARRIARIMSMSPKPANLIAEEIASIFLRFDRELDVTTEHIGNSIMLSVTHRGMGVGKIQIWDTRLNFSSYDYDNQREWRFPTYPDWTNLVGLLEVELVPFLYELPEAQNLTDSQKPNKSSPRTPKDRTRAKAEVFKKIKDANPRLSYVNVAMRAQKEFPDETITEDTVRNAYRAMDWPWERADRIR